MSFDWQSLVVVAIVLAAAGYLAVGAWRSVARRKAAACGACGDCAHSAGGRQVVSIDLLSHAPGTGPTDRAPSSDAS